MRDIFGGEVESGAARTPPRRALCSVTPCGLIVAPPETIGQAAVACFPGATDTAPHVACLYFVISPERSPALRAESTCRATGRHLFRHDASSGKPTVGESIPVSEGGGFAPRWRGDGKELFYLKIDGSVMRVEVKTPTGAFAPGSSKRLFTALGVFPEWGVTGDGSRLFFAVPTAPTPPLSIIQNWQSALPN